MWRVTWSRGLSSAARTRRRNVLAEWRRRRGGTGGRFTGGRSGTGTRGREPPPAEEEFELRLRRHGSGGFDLPGHSVLVGLIGANAAVYGLWQLPHTHEAYASMQRHFMVSFGALAGGRAHTLLTHAFSHVDFAHVAMNMVVLYFFGSAAAQVLGGARFLALYTGSALSGAVAQLAYNETRDDREARRKIPMLGASASVNASVILSCILFPTRTVLLYFIIPMPAALLGGLFVLKDLVGAYKGTGTVGQGTGHRQREARSRRRRLCKKIIRMI